MILYYICARDVYATAESHEVNTMSHGIQDTLVDEEDGRRMDSTDHH